MPVKTRGRATATAAAPRRGAATTTAAAPAPDLPDLTAPPAADPEPSPASATNPSPAGSGDASPATAPPDATGQLLSALTLLTEQVANLGRRVDTVAGGPAAPAPVEPAGIDDDVEVGPGELVRQVVFDHYAAAGGADTERFGVVLGVDVDPDTGRRTARVAWLPASDPVSFRELEVVE
jgi:hypothetical protein